MHNLISVKEDEVSKFSSYDSFNDNEISGVMCRRSDYRYGSLVINSVNGWDVGPQVIWCTPKLEYPFDRNGVFHWPDINEIRAYDKLDGTNILAYHYKDQNGKDCVSFKTRLTPTLQDGGFGSFLSMWMEMLEEHPWIYRAIDNNQDYNLSFELYGSRNPITVEYSIPLSVKLLFGVRLVDHAIKPPSELMVLEGDCAGNVLFSQSADLTEMYNELRNYMSGINNGGLYCEGAVLYAHTGGPSWRMFKCKPEEIEKIHWAASGYIPARDLWNTAINAFECGAPTLSDFIQLLSEEYTVEMINKSRIKIEKAFKNAMIHVEVVKSVNEVWGKAKAQGFDVTKDKAGTFRWMSQYFPKSHMRKVGSIILKQAGLQ